MLAASVARRSRRGVRLGVRLGLGRLPRSRGSSGQALVETPEFFVAVVLDDDAAALARAGEADLGAQGTAQVLLDPLEVGIRGPLRPSAGGFGLRLAEPPDELLGLADREFLAR